MTQYADKNFRVFPWDSRMKTALSCGPEHQRFNRSGLRSTIAPVPFLACGEEVAA